MEAEGQQGGTTLTTRSKPYNERRFTRVSKRLALASQQGGNTRSNIRSNKVRNAVSTREAFRKMSCQMLRVHRVTVLRDSAQLSARFWRAAKTSLK